MLFLIYKGSICIEKIIETDFIKSIQGKKDRQLIHLQAKQIKSKKLMKMEKGSLFGYESLEKGRKYMYTTKADSEGTRLFCIKMKHTRFKYILQAIKDFFHPVFSSIDKLLAEATNLLVKHHLKMKIGYRGQDVKKCGAYKLNNKEERELLHRVNEKISDLRKENFDKIIHAQNNKSLESLLVNSLQLKDHKICKAADNEGYRNLYYNQAHSNFGRLKNFSNPFSNLKENQGRNYILSLYFQRFILSLHLFYYLFIEFII